jgi:type VI protein secretion system component Hcp
VKRTIVIAAALLAVIAAGAGTYAYAAANDTTTISGCVASDGKLRVLSGADACKSNETPLSWNSVGPAGGQGPAGAAGAQGAAGPAGAQGAAGRDGRDGTSSNPDAADATMTVTGNQGAFSASPMVLIGLSHEVVAPQAVGIGGGGAAGKTIHKPFNVTKVVDSSSPKLMGALLNNSHVTVLITLPQGGTTKLTNAAISDYVLHGNTETWSFVYQKIEWTFGANTVIDDLQAAA